MDIIDMSNDVLRWWSGYDEMSDEETRGTEGRAPARGKKWKKATSSRRRRTEEGVVSPKKQFYALISRFTDFICTFEPTLGGILR
jgi:hypothetical protein